MFLQLVYISTMRRPLTETERLDILARSRANNRTSGITGLLVAGSNRFLQLLEGPEEAVETRFELVRNDPRHFAVVVLDKRFSETRHCPDWSMGYKVSKERARGETLTELVEALVAPIDDPDMRAQFMGFAQIHDRAA